MALESPPKCPGCHKPSMGFSKGLRRHFVCVQKDCGRLVVRYG